MAYLSACGRSWENSKLFFCYFHVRHGDPSRLIGNFVSTLTGDEFPEWCGIPRERPAINRFIENGRENACNKSVVKLRAAAAMHWVQQCCTSIIANAYHTDKRGALHYRYVAAGDARWFINNTGRIAATATSWEPHFCALWQSRHRRRL